MTGFMEPEFPVLTRRSPWVRRFLFFTSCFLGLAGIPGSIIGGTPHTGYGVVAYVDGSKPSTIEFDAYITTKTTDVLTEASTGCGYVPGTGQWYVQCGNFGSNWSAGDILHVDLRDGSGQTGSIEITLTNEAGDDAGITTLTPTGTFVKLLVSDMAVSRGSLVDIPVIMTGLGVADSVLAYQLTVAFDPEVVIAVGVTSEGTMTQNWEATLAAPRELEMVVGGFTTNLPSTRLVPDASILVKLRFLVHGNPSSQVSNTTIVRVLEAVIFTMDESITISHTKSGTLTVIVNPTTVDRDIQMSPNWNLVSLGVAPDPSEVPEAFNGLSVEYAFGYRSGEGPMSWDINRPAFLNDLTYLDGLHGYWIKFNSATPQTWNVTGNPITVSTPIPMYSGWNLIGYLPASSDSVHHAFQSLGSLYSYIFGFADGTPKSWDRARPAFLNDLNVLSMDMGYWVKMDSVRSLVYPSGGYLVPKRAVPRIRFQALTDSLPVVTPFLCDFWAEHQDQMSVGDTICVFDPDDVLCGKDFVKTDQGNIGFIVHVFGDDPTTAEKDEGAVEGDTLRFTINGDSACVVYGDYTWEKDQSKEIKLVLLSGVDMQGHGIAPPDGPALFHNYPNPFNASTVLTFRLSQPSPVRLEIFDELGRSIRTLIDHPSYKAGTYRMKWDGCNDQHERVPSGIYLGMLQAGNRKFTQKMVLLY